MSDAEQPKLPVGGSFTLTNKEVGLSKQLAANGEALNMDASSNNSINHQWYFAKTNVNDRYRLHNKQYGESKALHVIDTHNIYMAPTNEFLNQLWRVDKWEDGTQRLSNSVDSKDQFLGTSGVSPQLFLSPDDSAGKHWSFATVSSSSSMVTTSSMVSTSSAASFASSKSVATMPSASTLGPSQQPSNRALSSGAIAGIAIGALVALALCICAVVFFIRRMRGRKQERSEPFSVPAEMDSEAEKATDSTGQRSIPKATSPVELPVAVQVPVELSTQRL